MVEPQATYTANFYEEEPTNDETTAANSKAPERSSVFSMKQQVNIMARVLKKDDLQTKSAEDKHQAEELRKISKTLNRYVQNSDPYILSRYDAYMSK